MAECRHRVDDFERRRVDDEDVYLVRRTSARRCARRPTRSRLLAVGRPRFGRRRHGCGCAVDDDGSAVTAISGKEHDVVEHHGRRPRRPGAGPVGPAVLVAGSTSTAAEVPDSPSSSLWFQATDEVVRRVGLPAIDAELDRGDRLERVRGRTGGGVGRRRSTSRRRQPSCGSRPARHRTSPGAATVVFVSGSIATYSAMVRTHMRPFGRLQLARTARRRRSSRESHPTWDRRAGRGRAAPR